jgi:flagellar basal-body rod modification protein FlgD
MTIQSVLSAQEKAEVARNAEFFNQQLNAGKPKAGKGLGKDDFLKLLVTQLSHQDPMEPMQDKEFIAQMAQFSQLEQMTNMAENFNKLTSMVTNTQASSSLGKNVEITDGSQIVQGTVDAVSSSGPSPQVLVKGQYYDWSKVTGIYNK